MPSQMEALLSESSKVVGKVSGEINTALVKRKISKLQVAEWRARLQAIADILGEI